MQYQRRVQVLSALIVILSLALLGSFVFNPEARTVRQATGVLLESQKVQSITKIEITRPTVPTLSFIKRTGQWYAVRDGKEYPVKNDRIEDFLKPFGKPSLLPQRASSAQTHERLGLGANSASRVTFWADSAGKPILDMYFGSMDATGKELYFRFADSDVVKSVEDHFSSYIQSSPQSWYDLRLFPQSGNQGLKTELVQKITWAVDGKGSFSLSRSGPSSWSGTGGNLEGKELDTKKIDGFLQDLVSASGEDFADPVAYSSKLSRLSITAELGDGRTKKLIILSDFASQSYWATVSDTPYTYRLSEWQYNRLAKESTYFIKTEK
jgi:hypothetical protein